MPFILDHNSFPGWPDVFVKKSPKDNEKSPNHVFLDLLYKTVLWCFLFDFMLISNGTGHSFIVFFFYKKRRYNFLNIFETCKKTLLEQNFSLIKVNFWQFFYDQNFAQIIGRFFLEKICHKKSPKWRNFAQSGHPESLLRQF